MSRLNLTLAKDTLGAIDRYAAKSQMPRAKFARLLIQEGVIRRETLERRKKLAADYTKQRIDEFGEVDDLERAQLELLDDDV